MRVLARILLTVAGAAFAAFGIALVEAVTIASGFSDAGERGPRVGVGELAAADSGVLFPVAMLVSVIVVPFAMLVEPEGDTTLLEDIADIRADRASRLRAAALAPLLAVVIFVTTVGAAHIAKSFVGANRPAEAGLSIGLGTVTLAVAMTALALALLPWGWRLVARAATVSRLADPLFTGGVAAAVALLLLLLGVFTGDPGGGGGLVGVGLFGVLRRPELDLRPVVHALTMVVVAYVGGALARASFVRIAAGVGALFIVALAALSWRASSSLNAAPAVVEGIERHAALGRVALKALRRATDRDGDGHSARFGGADCNDSDPRINPTAIDIPGNGIDEDCSGEDTPLFVAKAPAPASAPASASASASAPASASASASAPASAPAPARRTFNVVIFTVDTLRYDLGFAGYPKPVTPNIDKLAAASTVFERAYSLSSYTAKSMGPMMIGRYPSETLRDYEHFTTYYPANTFVAERARAAGVHTVGGHCHYYWQWNTGLSQGFAVWDTSAIPPGMGDNDSSVTSDRLSDLALRLLSKPENVTPPGGDGGEPRRFFAWFHYFDPHAQYVRHPGAPDFRSMEGGQPGRWIYDEEVWFTDKHIGRVLDHIAAQPWGKDTAVILTADHGEAFGDHGVRTHGHELYEPLVRVPLVLYVPGAAPRRVSVKRSAIDIAPTILELLGAPPAPPGELRGASLVADVNAAPGAQLEERDVYLDMPEGPYNDVRRALITGPTPGMKLMHFGGRRYQLYDLARDPAESQDLASDEARFRPVMDRMQQTRAGLSEIAASGGRGR